MPQPPRHRRASTPDAPPASQQPETAPQQAETDPPKAPSWAERALARQSGGARPMHKTSPAVEAAPRKAQPITRRAGRQSSTGGVIAWNTVGPGPREPAPEGQADRVVPRTTHELLKHFTTHRGKAPTKGPRG